MGKKIIINKDELIQKYSIEGLSQKKCAEYFGCSVDVIRSNMKDYGIPVHKPGTWSLSNTLIDLTNGKNEILDGAMLGDGNLEKHKNMVNAQFHYISKSYQHVEYIYQYFTEYISGINHYSIHDKRTNKTYEHWTFRTRSSQSFTEQYNRWYPNGVKHIPEDLVLTPTVCLIWYIGDGSLCKNNKNTIQYIKLATDCFEKDELERIILPQLKMFNPVLSLNGISKNGKENYQIRIRPKEKAIEFLNYIGECPFDDYKYKWDIKERKYPSYEQYYNEWKQLYLDGIKYKEIARKYNCDPSTVWHYLEKENIRKPFVGYKQFYEEWEQRYLNGEDYKDIAKDYGCCP